jgi:seryl-tRNA synthetase
MTTAVLDRFKQLLQQHPAVEEALSAEVLAERYATRAQLCKEVQQYRRDRDKLSGGIRTEDLADAEREEKARQKLEEIVARRHARSSEVTIACGRMQSECERRERAIRKDAPRIIDETRVEVVSRYNADRGERLAEAFPGQRSLRGVLEWIEREEWIRPGSTNPDTVLNGGMKRLQAMADALDQLAALELEPDVQVIEATVAGIRTQLKLQ